MPPSAVVAPPLAPQAPSPVPQEEERIWYQDPRGFLREDRLTHVLPEPDTPLDAQLNAVARFALYVALFVALYRRSLTPAVAIVLTAAVVTFAVHRAEWAREQPVRERMEALGLEVDPATRRLCTRPTSDNPFGNVLMSDYTRFPERPAACDVTRPDVRRAAEDLASHDLFADQDDLYGRKVNNRQFVTNPATTIPNDQQTFADWLYRTVPPGRGTCREGDGDACAALTFTPYPRT